MVALILQLQYADNRIIVKVIERCVNVAQGPIL